MNNKEVTKLTIPSRPQYISVIRLVASGIGSQLNLSIDDIEDLKVSVAEACINVINFGNTDEISVEFIVNETELIIEIEDVVHSISKESENYMESNLGLMIIESLMDEVTFTDKGVKLIKYII